MNVLLLDHLKSQRAINRLLLPSRLLRISENKSELYFEVKIRSISLLYSLPISLLFGCYVSDQ
jgi:hypothetical protein